MEYLLKTKILTFIILLCSQISFAQWYQNGAGNYHSYLLGRAAIGTDYFEFSDRLSIEGDSEWQIRLKDKGIGGLNWRIASTSDNWWAGGGKFLISRSQTSTHAAFAIDPLDRVGIGTVTPQHRLEIADHFGTATLGLRGASDSKIFFEAVDGSDRFNIWSDTDSFTSNDLLRFGTFLVPDVFTIKGDGKVGIGTINPGSFKLAVEGAIGAREINVTLANPWPDYVFEKNYNLLTLAEVENYISQNKHLPEVPAAKEMETNGVNLGEMNMLLLKKVEELTLYMIELQKENEKQNVLIQKLLSEK